jgi:Mn2+/Fe2+ NRAMP family transporter
MVPVAVAPPVTPSTDHCTPTLVVPDTVAVNCFVVFAVTLAVVGEIATVTCDCASAVAKQPTKQTVTNIRRRLAANGASNLNFTLCKEIVMIQDLDLSTPDIRTQSDIRQIGK